MAHCGTPSWKPPPPCPCRAPLSTHNPVLTNTSPAQRVIATSSACLVIATRALLQGRHTAKPSRRSIQGSGQGRMRSNRTDTQGTLKLLAFGSPNLENFGFVGRDFKKNPRRRERVDEAPGQGGGMGTSTPTRMPCCPNRSAPCHTDAPLPL